MQEKIPKIDTVWTDGQGKIFTVTDLKEDDKGLWVYYTNNTSNQNYNTLVEAFLNRLMEIPK